MVARGVSARGSSPTKLPRRPVIRIGSYYTAGDGNGAGNFASVTDPSGHTTRYGHEPITGKVTSTTLPDGRVRSWTWLSKDYSTTQQPYYLSVYTDERGQLTIYHRDSGTGLVTQIDHPDGGRENFSYRSWTVNSNTFYKVYCYTDVRGAQTINGYDETDVNHGGSGQNHFGLLTSVTRSYLDSTNTLKQDRTILYYDALDRLVQSVDPRGVTTKFAYNSRHQIIRTTHLADGTHTDCSYDDNGNCTDVADERGHSVHTVYDEYRRPTLVVNPVNDGINDHHVDYFSYDPRDTNNNSLSSATSHTRSTWSVHQQQSSRATLRVYSPNNWLTDTYAGMSSAGSIHVNYTAVGQPQTGTDAFGYQTTSTYDNCNRLATTTDPNGHVSTTAYYGRGETATAGGGINCAGLLKSVSVPGPDTGLPTVTTYSANYDQMGRLGQTVAPPNGSTISNIAFNSGYNAAGDLTSQDDGAQASGGHQTGYGYDQLGRKASCSYPDGTVERWTYDASGNVATYVNRAQQTKTYSYDGRNRLTFTSWSNNAASPTGYEYDNASRMTRVYNWNSDNRFTYSDAGELLTESAQLPSQPLLTTSYKHDIDGRVTDIQYPHGDQPHFDYDLQGKCTGVWFGDNNNKTYYSRSIYDGKNQLAYRCLPAAGLVTGYSYQHNGRLSYVWDYKGDASGNHAANGSIRLQFYGYAPSGQMSWTYRAAGGDQSGRNSQLDNNQGDAYYYYADGSLNAAYRNVGVQNNVWPAQQDPTMDARVDPSKIVPPPGVRITNIKENYTYDRAGNRLTAGTASNQLSYSADGENRYNSVLLNGAQSNGTASPMSYDANGNTSDALRGWKCNYDAENHLMNAFGPNGQAMYFAYDGLGRMSAENVNGLAKVYYYAGSQRIEERNSSTQAALDQYYFDGPGSDLIFLRVDNQRGYLWYLYDAQGNTTHLCDSGGNVLEMYLYDAHGTPTVYDPSGNVRSGGTAWDNRYLFKGAAAYQWYAPAGLYHCRARFHQPYHGRWLQPDPIGQAGGLNIYTYCGNDPVNKSDPSGLTTTIIYSGNSVAGVDLGHISIGTSGPVLGELYAGMQVSFGKLPITEGTTLTGSLGSVGLSDDTPLRGTFVINTTPAQERAINEYIQAFASEDQYYALSGLGANNCATFVYNALKAAGLDVGKSRVPSTLFSHISKRLKPIEYKVPKQASPDLPGSNYPGVNYASGTLSIDPHAIWAGDPSNSSNEQVTVYDENGHLLDDQGNAMIGFITSPVSSPILNGATVFSNSVGLDMFTRGGGGGVNRPFSGGGTFGLNQAR